MNPTHRNLRLRNTLLTVAAAAILLAACGSSSGNAITPLKTTPTTTGVATTATTADPPPVTSTTAPTAAAAIIAGYRAEEAAFYAVASHNPPDPTDPRLPATMTGEQLAAVRNRLTVARLQRQYAVGTVDLAPVVMAITGDTAILNDCLFDHGRIVDGRTGQTVSGPDTQRTLEKVTMQLEAGVWKVALNQKEGSGCTPAV